MIITFDISPELRYFSKVVMLIFLTELKLFEFPKYENIMNIEIISP